MRVHPVPRMLKKTSRLLGVCLSSVLDTKVWGKIVRQNQWCLLQVYRSQESSPCWPCLCLVSMELQTCCRPLCSEPGEKCFFTAPSSPALHGFPQNNQSNPHFPTLHLCVCVYLHTLWWGIRRGRGGATRRWMWRLSVVAVKAPPTVRALPPSAPL